VNVVAECAAIAERGFAILPTVFSAESVDRAVADIERLCPHRSRAGVRHALSLGPVAEVARSPQLIELASAVLGQACFLFRATLFEKTIRANWLVVWHQETALPLRERRKLHGWGPWSIKEGITYAHAPAAALSQVLALRIHIDDSTCENGPLRVLPATHLLGVLSHDQIHELTTRIIPLDCVAAKGCVVAMHPLVVHASSKSRMEMPRTVLHIEYAASEWIVAPLRLAPA
jgi:ectoine hydroxylase-related dioxygenase (phytanoyl-CoA dioxygenase family)